MSTFVIAEAGSCHDGRWTWAMYLVKEAAKAGANACKFQYWSSAERLAERRNAADYLEIYRRYQVDWWWLGQLRDACEDHKIEFMCTVYLPEDIATVAPFVKRFKVASFEAGDEDFVKAHDGYDKEIIISTGMSHDERLDPWGRSYLHCVSSYPCPPEQANLRVIHDDKRYAGYSDHTHNVLTGALAVAAGARILEVHFKLDDTDPANPDYATALSPGQLKDYIALVRQAEVMLGDGIKRPQACEAEMSKYRVKP